MKTSPLHFYLLKNLDFSRSVFLRDLVFECMTKLHAIEAAQVHIFNPHHSWFLTFRVNGLLRIISRAFTPHIYKPA
jgi:hypothetical protein